MRTILGRSTIGQALARVAGRLHGPLPGRVDFGALRRNLPVSSDFGFDRGVPIDRYYIEKFLEAHAGDISGDVLEVKDSAYTERYGGDRVGDSHVLSLSGQDGTPNIVADLARADNVPSDAFDCIILTQTLQLIYDLPAATDTLHRILKPGGVLLATVPGISKIARDPLNLWADEWRLTSDSCQRLFQSRFSCETLTIKAYGNVLSAIAFLEGIAVHELTESELDYHDPDYEVIVTVRAVKG